MDWFPTVALQAKARLVTERLEAVYQVVGPERGNFRRLPAVDELVLTLLSQSTTDINSWRGYQALLARFPDWEAVAAAPLAAIEDTIRPCGLARQKAPRLKEILQRLRAEQGSITLDFLSEMPPDEALAYLMTLHGVGRKTASCVLLFSLEMAALPVDTHVWRVARRLGLLPDRGSADAAHALLESLLPEDYYLPFHVNVIAHGRRTCTARHPACARCPVLDLCPYGQTNIPTPTSNIVP